MQFGSPKKGSDRESGREEIRPGANRFLIHKPYQYFILARIPHHLPRSQSLNGIPTELKRAETGKRDRTDLLSGEGHFRRLRDTAESAARDIRTEIGRSIGKKKGKGIRRVAKTRFLERKSLFKNVSKIVPLTFALFGRANIYKKAYCPNSVDVTKSNKVKHRGTTDSPGMRHHRG